MANVPRPVPSSEPRDPIDGAAGLLLAAAGGVAVAAAWQALELRRALFRGRTLARAAERFEAHPPCAAARVLLLGDSTGVGVGLADAKESLAGLLAQAFPQAKVINACRNGARVGDLLAQWPGSLRAPHPDEPAVDLVLVLAGGNDVLKSTRPARLEADADALLRELGRRARRVVWLGCADIGASPVMHRPLAWLLGWLTRRTTALLAAVARRHGATFIDFSTEPLARAFDGDRRRWFADDGLHPSAASHRRCFDELCRHAPLVALLARRPIPIHPHPRGAPRWHELPKS